MKRNKLLSILLVFILCLSLCACENTGEKNEETTQEQANNTPESIEITVDNWTDYFEIKEVPMWKFNAFDEVESLNSIHNFLCLKEEYRERGISPDTQLAFEYELSRKPYNYEADVTTQTLTYGDAVDYADYFDDAELIETLTLKDVKDTFKYEPMTDEFLKDFREDGCFVVSETEKLPVNAVVKSICMSVADPMTVFVSGAGEVTFDTLTRIESFNFTRIEGTLVFEN